MTNSLTIHKILSLIKAVITDDSEVSVHTQAVVIQLCEAAGCLLNAIQEESPDAKE